MLTPLLLSVFHLHKLFALNSAETKFRNAVKQELDVADNHGGGMCSHFGTGGSWNRELCGVPECSLQVPPYQTRAGCPVKIVSQEMCDSYGPAVAALKHFDWGDRFVSKAYLPLSYITALLTLLSLTLLAKFHHCKRISIERKTLI